MAKLCSKPSSAKSSKKTPPTPRASAPADAAAVGALADGWSITTGRQGAKLSFALEGPLPITSARPEFRSGDLVIGYPFAYHLATRTPRVRAVLLVLVMLPFWSNFLVRTYAWRVLLGSDGPLLGLLGALGIDDVVLLFTPFAIVLGLVYGFLPFMVLPLYAAIERIDHTLIEAARDLHANGWGAFRAVTLPLSRSGVIAGSVLVFIPAFGAYVTPELLGGSRTTMLGSYVVRQFLSARDWPFGSALSVAILAVMLLATTAYFRTGGRSL
jgi:spermidine/putrescine transport system permease protein